MKKFIGKVIPIFISVILMIGTTVVGVSADETDIEYDYIVLNNGTVAIDLITSSIYDESYLTFPSEIDGYTVSAIVGSSGTFEMSVRQVTLPSTIKTVGEYDYDGETIIEKNIFSNLSDNAKLQRINVDNDNPYLSSYSGVLFNKDKTKIIAYPKNRLDSSYRIPNSVKVIGSYAFNYCKDLNEIQIPNSVTTIGDGAFANCEYLSDLKLPNSITEIGKSAFWDCASFKEIVIPNKVTKLNSSTFTWCDNLRKLTIPKSVTDINSGMIAEYTGIFDKLTIYGYTNSEAEKYANSKNIKFVSLGNAIEKDPEDNFNYSTYKPYEFLNKSFNEITNMFGDDYIEVDEPETGLDKCIAYPNTGNPFEFLIDYDTNIVKYVWIYDISDDPINLFDDITNKSTLTDIEKSTTSYTYSKWVGENIFNGNNVEQYVTYKIKDGIAFRLEWTTNDFDNQSANRVLVFQSEDEVIPAETTESISVETTKPTATNLEINPTNSTDVTSKISTKDTATSDSINNDNGSIQTGTVSIAIIIFILLASLATGGCVWYKRKF